MYSTRVVSAAVNRQIVNLYDEKLLTKDILTILMKSVEEYSHCDETVATAKDGKDAFEIIFMIMRPEKYASVPDSMNFWEWLEEAEEDDEYIYENTNYEIFREIMREDFGHWYF